MKFIYGAIDREMLKRAQQMQGLMEIFQYLLNRFGGSVEEAMQAMQQLQELGYLDKKTNLDDFRQELENSGLIQNQPEGGSTLSHKGERALREAAFNEVFKNMKKGGKGDHRLGKSGTTPSTEPEASRPWQSGDETSQVRLNESLLNSIKRSGELGMPLSQEDLAVNETELATGAATVLLIDISHSMILYGEDRITPAKKVAMAFSHLIQTKFPKDELSVVLFGNEASEVPLKNLPYINVGPFHTNTQEGLALARKILLKKRQPNRQIFMITDGKPTLMRQPNGELYRNSFGLDPKIVSRTLDEAVYCRKKGIEISTFMLAQDPYLREFVEKLSELNRGRAFFSSLDNLGSFMMWDFIKNRKRHF